MPRLDPDRQRQFAVDVVRRLAEAQFEAYWAGGCVRDQLLGLVPKDYDVATNATPEQIREVFGRRRTLSIGAAFGVVTVLGPRPAGQIEVATFREDAGYSDGRHPDRVTFSGAQQDACRRDFTINGLFFNPLGGQVIDYVGGQADLSARLIRAIGDPAERIAEDKLRLLRAVRIAAAYDFTIEPATLAAIQRSAAEITQVSAERIGMEVRRMLVDAARTRAVTLLVETNLLAAVLPELAALSPSLMGDTKRVLVTLEQPTFALALAATLYYAGGGEVVPKIGRRLRLTNKETERAAWLLDALPLTRAASTAPWPRLQRVLVHPGAVELIALHEAVAGADDPDLVYCRERLSLPAEQLNPTPLVDGAALIAHGLQPGPEFSVLLEKVRDAQLLGEVATRDEALALVDGLRATGLDET